MTKNRSKNSESPSVFLFENKSARLNHMRRGFAATEFFLDVWKRQAAAISAGLQELRIPKGIRCGGERLQRPKASEPFACITLQGGEESTPRLTRNETIRQRQRQRGCCRTCLDLTSCGCVSARLRHLALTARLPCSRVLTD